MSRWAAWLIGLAVLSIAAWGLQQFFLASDVASRDFSRAVELAAAGDLAAAEDKAWKVWKRNSQLPEAAILAAEMALRQQRFEAAVEYASAVPETNPEHRLHALRLIGRTQFQHLSQFTAAEQSYREALALHAADPESNTELAKLLGTCGRRYEAIPLVLRLVRDGYASDLLMLLAKEDAVINDVPALENAERVSPSDPLPLVGLAWHAAENSAIEPALERLRKAMQLDRKLACAQVAYASLLAEEGRFADLQSWESQLGDLRPQVDQFADTWIARGQLAEHLQDKSGAIRCYLEATQRSPDSRIGNVRLAQLLEGYDAQAAVTFRDYAARTQELKDEQNQVLFSGNTRRMPNLIDKYIAVGRLWEAFGWCQLALANDPMQRDVRERLQNLQSQLAGLPLQLVAPDVLPARSVDFAKYPLPQFSRPLAEASQKPERNSVVSNLGFDEIAEQVGLQFRFFNGASGSPNKRMYEFTGGGVGVLDFDLDGFPDLVLTQGTPWPPDSKEREFEDTLFRNVGGERWEACNTLNLAEDGFGQGISMGDFDADGFEDIYIAQIGQNRLLRNNGDGTFSDVTTVCQFIDTAWTTSCVMADLNHDSLPDIYDVNYVQGSDVFDRICTAADGQPSICMPFDFEAAPDRLWINNGDGSFRDGATTLSGVTAGKGLGVVAMRADEQSRMSLFVANDTTPNFWFTPDFDSASSGQLHDGQLHDGQLHDGQLHERGVGSGFAFNGQGSSEGSMGIATADVNHDGRIDLLVTNFLNESNTLYGNRSGGQFSDETRALGLREPSLGVLGFGTQFLDADLDGLDELFVANGHIDDFSRLNRPYKMESQLFAQARGRFALVPPSPKVAYLGKPILGRAVAKLDWNNDGREDLVVGQLYDNYALLTNSSEPHGRFVSIRLIGTRSSRDAVGTIVRLQAGSVTTVKQLTAGDGYQASNQHHLIFGIGNADQADFIRIHWPAGGVQELTNIPANSRLEVIEQ